MKYKAILFDLDGTLLPMDYAAFTKGYFSLLYRRAAEFGYTKEQFIGAMWKGVESMVKNDGTQPNADRFWNTFAAILGDGILDCKDTFDEFYRTDFAKTVEYTSPNAEAKTAVELAKDNAEKVILATNPLFPDVATIARMGFVGLSPEDFDFFTHYENSTTCKPNPAYYTEICDKMGIDPRECLMIGNNTEEDVIAASKVGMDTYLITDCLICEGEMPECKKGSFGDMLEFLRGLKI